MTPQKRQMLVVRDCAQNRANDFWRPHIGKAGIVADFGPDGMIDVVIVGKGDGLAAAAAGRAGKLAVWLLTADHNVGNVCCTFGVSADRFEFGAVIPEPSSPAPRAWWRRLLFWRRA